MAVNLLENASDTLDALPVGDARCWLDGSVAPFCSVLKIKEHQGLNWNYVPRAENPAVVGRRGRRT